MTSFAGVDGPYADWIARLAEGEYLTIGAQLATRDGRRMGNAVVTRLESDLAHVVTDAGSWLKLNSAELREIFYPPRFIMKHAALADFISARPDKTSHTCDAEDGRRCTVCGRWERGA